MMSWIFWKKSENKKNNENYSERNFLSLDLSSFPEELSSSDQLFCVHALPGGARVCDTHLLCQVAERLLGQLVQIRGVELGFLEALVYPDQGLALYAALCPGRPQLLPGQVVAAVLVQLFPVPVVQLLVVVEEAAVARDQQHVRHNLAQILIAVRLLREVHVVFLQRRDGFLRQTDEPLWLFQKRAVRFLLEVQQRVVPELNLIRDWFLLDKILFQTQSDEQEAHRVLHPPVVLAQVKWDWVLEAAHAVVVYLLVFL